MVIMQKNKVAIKMNLGALPDGFIIFRNNLQCFFFILILYIMYKAVGSDVLYYVYAFMTIFYTFTLFIYSSHFTWLLYISIRK